MSSSSAGDGPLSGMQFGDQKDRARLLICMGPCLKKYPGVFEFAMKRSMEFNGLQTLFIGSDAKLIFYHDDESVETEYDIRELGADEIESLLTKHGVSRRRR